MKQSLQRKAVMFRVHRTPVLSGHQRRTFFWWWCCFSLQLLSAIITAQSYSSSVEEGNDFDSSSSSFTSYENPEQCRGEWKHPPDCGSPPNTAGSVSCDYRAAWEYRDEDDQIVFTISTKNRNKWTGIGFSENQHMPETDAILGLVEESGRFFLMDSWLQAYEAPPLDPIQNLYNQTAWRENGITTLKFSRPRQTGDSRDYQFSDSACPYFVFPVMGGVFNAVNKRIRKHEATPVVSERRICVRSCRPPSSSTTAVISTSSSSSSSSSSTTTTMAPTSTSKSSKSSASTTTPSSAGAAAGASSSSSSVIPTTSKTTTGDDNGGGGEASGNEVVHGYSEPTGDSTTSTEDEHPTRLYRIELKMLHFNQLIGSKNDNNNVHSEEYQAMLATLEASLYQELKLLFDRVRRLEVSEVVAVNDSSTATTTTKDEHNQPTLVIFELTVAPKKASVGGNKEQQQQQQGDDTQSLTLALSSVIRDQRIGSQFTVDSGYLVVVRKDDNRGRLVAWINSALNSIGFSSRFTDDEQKWIIIGVGISALVLLALIQALCMFCRCSGGGGGRDGDDNGSSGSFADRLRTGEDGYLDEKDNVDKQWKEYNSAVAEQYHHHHQHHQQPHYNGGGYNGYEEYGVVATAANGYGHNKSNSLHKNYGGGGGGAGRGHHQEHYAANYHPSLDRRQYEQQLMQQQHQQTNGRSRGHHNHSHQHEDHHHHHHHRDHRHSNGRGGGGGGQLYSMQPDYYFMPHQRKYSSDVVRVFVDYDHQ